MSFCKAMVPPLASLRSTANLLVNSASMMWLFSKEPPTSWEWQSNNSNLSENYKRHSIVISCFSKRSIIGSRIACRSSPACFTSKRMPRVLNWVRSLNEAASRISTVGRAYDRLAYAADYEKIDLTTYLKEVLNELERAVSPNVIHFEAPQGISILADRAILIGLIINELVSNAGKYAYPDRPGGPIWVTVAQIEKRTITLSIRDEGVGLPAGSTWQRASVPEHNSSLHCRSSWAQNLRNLRVPPAVIFRCSCHCKPYSAVVSLPH